MNPIAIATTPAANTNTSTIDPVAAEYARLAMVAESHWVGAKYQKGRDVKDIAKDVRRDIASAVKAGTLPAIKASVKIDRTSMSESIDVVITEIPVGFQAVSTERVRQEMGLSPVEPGKHLASYRTPEGNALLAAVEAIVNAYNFDKSDTLTDYHNREFYVSVTFGPGIESSQHEQIRSTLRAAYRGA